MHYHPQHRIAPAPKRPLYSLGEVCSRSIASRMRARLVEKPEFIVAAEGGKKVCSEDLISIFCVHEQVEHARVKWTSKE